ncbi:hypothetical protein ACWEQG_25335 [Microbispora sp. NPDC004025]
MAVAPNNAVVGELVPQASNHYTGSARRGVPWVFDANNNRWVNLSGVFGTGFFYDIALAPAPSRPLAQVPTNPNILQAISLPNTGDPAGLLRVSARRADGSIFRSDCRVSDPTDPLNSFVWREIPLSAANCTAPARLPVG